MPTVIINDVEMEAKLGERLLNVARRNAAHIGFVCDGNGVCQTCLCRVLEGGDQLSPPNDAERIWMPPNRINAGYRLACQAGLRGKGQVRVLTLVEELRRQTLDVVSPRDDVPLGDRLGPLLDNFVRLNLDQLAHFPFNILETLLRVGPVKFTFPLQDTGKWIEDGTRIARNVPTTPRRLAAAESVTEERVLRAAREVRRARAALEDGRG